MLFLYSYFFDFVSYFFILYHIFYFVSYFFILYHFLILYHIFPVSVVVTDGNFALGCGPGTDYL
jgi:hypothetical protein